MIKIKNLTAVALMCALMAVCSFIQIPFAVPITLQTFSVFFALYLLGGKKGILSVFLYLLIGAAGVPVFSGFRGGIGVFFDATGGFVIGFLVLSLCYALMTSLTKGRMCIAVSLLSLLVLYLCGSLWYCFVYLDKGNYLEAVTVTVFPFIIPDLLKMLFAYYLSKRVRGYIRL